MRTVRLRPMQDAQLERSRVDLAAESHSYEPGILGGVAPTGMSDDRLEVMLGVGDGVWEAARRAIDAWGPFALGWAEVATGHRSPYPGQDVVVQARLYGLRFTLASRVLEVHDHARIGLESYGFTYGTLESHAESGEELFEVWRDGASGEVGYRIHAMAGPGNWYTTIGRPIVDRIRGRFRRDSADSMKRIVEPRA